MKNFQSKEEIVSSHIEQANNHLNDATAAYSTPVSASSNGQLYNHINDATAAYSTPVSASRNGQLYNHINDATAAYSTPVSASSNGQLYNHINDATAAYSTPVSASSNGQLYNHINDATAAYSTPVSASRNGQSTHHINDPTAAYSSPVSASSNGSKRVSRLDIALVHSLIEGCLQSHMDKEETAKRLFTWAKIDTRFTTLVWEKLEEENAEFFREYHRRLKLKRQIERFNELVAVLSDEAFYDSKGNNLLTYLWDTLCYSSLP
ncbi:uncharacterized protein G2W53_022942 [Senna tora]|uniref:Uncharacterized protein n=1 Tax=Senna tora TaxID=362788 RepID=A0A834TM42_9FABA|nr:uncharacterized protein G2W53_022942 [Senna tora]